MLRGAGLPAVLRMHGALFIHSTVVHTTPYGDFVHCQLIKGSSASWHKGWRSTHCQSLAACSARYRCISMHCCSSANSHASSAYYM
ncbi:hypothetical protein COO60DRAFT_942923 [Scenedesmus sp. NREL 46B-D3]|nr:hypothetical protein COO60DRAFT_942923 [Scenedesmus sp. NREL 46B-D3]